MFDDRKNSTADDCTSKHGKDESECYQGLIDPHEGEKVEHASFHLEVQKGMWVEGNRKSWSIYRGLVVMDISVCHVGQANHSRKTAYGLITFARYVNFDQGLSLAR